MDLMTFSGYAAVFWATPVVLVCVLSLIAAVVGAVVSLIGRRR